MDAQATERGGETDLSYRALVERVVAGDVPAWREFVERFSKLLFSLLWRYANGDQDQCADLYLYVVEGLHQTNESGETFHRLRRYLESLGQYQGKGRLTTWLGRVTQNLVSDYFREQEGRKTLPRNIQRLDLLHQQLFKLLYWEGCSEREAFATLASAGKTISRAKFDRMVDAINRCLKACNRWSLYTEVLRRVPALPLHPNPEDGGDGGPAPIQAADPNPASIPHEQAVLHQEQADARALGERLRELLRDLPDTARTLLVCRFKHGMTAGEIARLMHRGEEKKIYSEIEQIKGQIKAKLSEAGFRWETVAGGLQALEGLLDEFDSRKINKLAGKRA
jgi:RNA polymerase sigma factor (sigma-70 family)